MCEEFTLKWVEGLKRSCCSRLAITLHDLELDNHVSLTLSPSSGGDSSAEWTGTVGKYGGLPGVFTTGVYALPHASNFAKSLNLQVKKMDIVLMRIKYMDSGPIKSSRHGIGTIKVGISKALLDPILHASNGWDG